MNDVLNCVGLTKSYKNQPVLNQLDFNVERGKIIGLLGPNGCGKTTLIKLVAGLLTPDKGEIYINGKLRTEESNKDISYLPERTYLRSSQKVGDILDYFAEFFSDFDHVLAKNMLKDLDITDDRTLNTLSKGTKEKVQLVLTMARKTSLYILDEPIGGVDPAARDYVLKTIIGSYSPQSSVIICTHLIADIEVALDQFAFLGPDGKIALLGSVEDVREQRSMSLNQLFKETFRYV